MIGKERNAKGQYLPGSGGSKGRPTAAKEIAYLETFKKHVTHPRMGEMIEAVIGIVLDADAKDRDRIAGFAAICKHLVPVVQPDDEKQAEKPKNQNIVIRVVGVDEREVTIQ